MRTPSQKLIALFLTLAFVGTSVFYVAQPTPVFAQIPDFITTPVAPGAPLVGFATPAPKPTVVIGDLWGSFLQGVIKAAESAGYTIIRKYVRQGLSNLTKDVWKGLLTGGKGQEEMFRTEPWDQFWEQATDEAVGSAIEGFAQGFENEYELQKQKQANLQNLNENYGKLNEEDKKKEADALAKTPAQATPIEQTWLTSWNQAGSSGLAKSCAQLQAEGTPFTTPCLDLQTRPGATAQQILTDAEKNALTLYEQQGCFQNSLSQVCQEARNSTRLQNALSKRSGIQTRLQAEYEIEKKKLEAGRDDADKTARLKANKADADLIAGNVGALSEASKTFVDIVCKPEPDIAFRIFLGLGDQISLAKRKPICPLSVLKENWQEVLANTGAKLDPANLNGWNALAALLDPGNSDLGTSWKLSIGGHSVGSLAQNLATTGFLSEAAVGQIKNLTDFSGKTNTPASVIRSVAENTLKVQIEEDTRFIPTGHLLADLILTAGSTVLSTSLNILTEGLRKKQVVARNSRKGVTGEAFAQLTRGGSEDVLRNPSANPDFGGVEAAEARLAEFSRLDLSPPRDWKVLSKLTSQSCPDGMPGGAKGGDIDACVMDDKFAEAVKERITVKEARARGLLNGDGAFGFDVQSNSNPPRSLSWQRNFPYRSLVIMRKYRVLPVSWELAALYIQKNPTVCSGGSSLNIRIRNCTLSDLITMSKNASSPFFGMIDENWVLKIPPVLCALKGYGPEYQESTPSKECDKNDPTKCKTTTNVIRAPEQCVDYQTCLDEDEEGKCRDSRYGYCLQEQKVIRFKGEKCDEKYNGCESFQDTQTKSTAGYLKQSLQQYADLATGACTPRNAGCQWYSATRGVAFPGSPSRADLGTNMKAKVATRNIGGTLVQQEWLSELSDKVYFASSVQKCNAGAEGCRAISGPAGTPAYLRLPPLSLQCLTDGIKKDGTVVPWYKREDCKEYTQLCTSDYKGCQQYMPQGDTVAVTGTVPGSPTDINPYRCPSACANILSYAEQKTLFDESGTDRSRGSTYFNAATAQKCSIADIADVGCEEFTNLEEVGSRGGERKEYYTYLQRCVQEDNPDAIPANQVFYSFVGSDTAGDQPEKYYLVGEGTAGSAGYRPARIDTTRVCDKDTFKRQQYDPRVGTMVCREFVNASGAVSYEWTDNLIYRTADCTRFRRTIDGDAALTHTYSPQFSRACSSRAAANCREYRAPQAGNVRVLPYDNFEESGGNTTWKNWDANTITPANNLSKATLTLSNEGEVLGDHSMKITTTPVVPTTNITPQLVYIEKTVSLSKGKNYSVEFNAKRTEGLAVGGGHQIGVSFFGFQGGGEVFLDDYQKLNEKDQWKHFKYTMTLAQSVLEGEGKMLIIFLRPLTGDQVFYLDDIIIKEVEGIEYLVRDSWTRNGSCFKQISLADPTPDFNSPAYPNCSLYTDKEGTQHALMSFQRVCPNEMAGCVQVAVKEGKVNPADTTKLIDGDPIYIIPNESKACRAEDNKCTAYGSPKLLTSLAPGDPAPIKRSKVDSTTYKEEWNSAYYKVTPLDSIVGQNTFATGNPKPYDQGICQQADVGCREYAPGSKGDHLAYFRAPGVRVCQPPEAGDLTGFYHACERSATTDTFADYILCMSDNDCPITGGIQEKCNTKKKIVDPSSATGCPANFVLACPASAAGCRKISDPECPELTKTLRTDYGRGTAGVPCTPAYYFTEDLDTRTKECNGKVNVEEGCLLLDDEGKAKYEYTKDAGTGSVVGVNTVANPPYCRCDTNPAVKNCTPTFSATEFDPTHCYDQYSTPTGAELQRYTRNPTDKKYDSGRYYKEAQGGVSARLGSITSEPIKKDANVLMKVKQDRQCKTWLKCTGFWKEGEREICFQRDLCDMWGVGNSCANTSTATAAIPAGSTGLVDGTSTIQRPAISALSGIARPDYKFNATTQKTEGGYGFNFDTWTQDPETDVENRSYSRLELATARTNNKIINSCRLYPQQTTSITTPSNIVDACRVEAGSYGIYGYCLEPYPNYKTDYYGSNNYYRRVCTNLYTKDCVNAAVDCPTGGKCGFRYYENACLTWLPVDRIEGQRNLFTSQTGQEMSMYHATAENVYYCLDTQETTKLWPETITYAPPNTKSSEKKVRHSNGITGASGKFNSGGCVQFGGGRFLPGAVAPICINDDPYDLTQDLANNAGYLIPYTLNPKRQDVVVARNIAGNVKSIAPLSEESAYYNWKKQATGAISRLQIDLYPISYFRDQVGGGAGYGSHEMPIGGDGKGFEVGADRKYIYSADAQNGNTPMVFKIVKETKYGDATYDTDYSDTTINNETDSNSADNVKIFKDGMSGSKVNCAELKNDDGEVNEVFRTDDKKDVIYVGLLPKWGSTMITSASTTGLVFDGWKFAICQDPTVFGSHAIDGLDNDIFFAIAFDAHFRYIDSYPSQTLTYQYKETVCKDFIKVVDNGQVVPNGLMNNVPPGSIQYPVYAGTDPNDPATPNAGEPVRYKVQGMNWQNCDSTAENIIQNNLNPARLVNQSGITPGAFTCTSAPPDFQSKLPLNRIDNPTQSKNIRLLGPLDQNNGCTTRDMDPSCISSPATKGFAKVYEYWALGVVTSNVYTKTAAWTGTWFDAFIGNINGGYNQLKNFWNKSMEYARTGHTGLNDSDGNRPRIYGVRNDQGNSFAHNTFDANKIEVRFYAKVKDNQLPIKDLYIQWDKDGNPQNKTTVAKSTFDGRGTAVKPPPASEEPIDTFSGYGPFHYEYRTGGFAGKKVCVTIQDNWDAKTTTCGIFDASGKVPPGGWTTN